MKLITAIIRPEKLIDVKKELWDIKVYRMTVSNVIGAGQQKGYTEQYRGVVHEVKLNKKVKIEVAVNESYVEPTIKAIVKGARSNGGAIGDGKIFITDLKECIRIRTGEKGVAAIGGESKEVNSLKKKGKS